MINKEMRFIAEGIKIILNTAMYEENKSAMEWVKKYPEMFPKPVPFGGPINEEEDTS